MTKSQHKLLQSSFFDLAEHKRIFALALPMILSNITTPLLGMVDTAVVGHMGQVDYVAGTAIGAMIVTQLYWICGFLRMTATGLSAQAKGKDSLTDAVRVLLQSLGLALLLGGSFVILHSVILQLGLFFADASGQVLISTTEYFNIRIWGAPVALANMALIGWLIGQQRVKIVMLLQILANVLNAALDIVLVYGFDWGVEGPAAASVAAEVFIFVGALFAISPGLKSVNIVGDWFVPRAFKSILSLNSHMLIRNLALQLCLAFITFQGARLGELTVATNAILMQFFVLCALGLDGIAYAVEALVGESKGANAHTQLTMRVRRGLLWSSMVALGYGLVYWLFSEAIIDLLTDLPQLRASARDYLIFIWLLPLVGHWCFLFDGVFIGLTRARAMSVSMLISAFVVFFPLWWLFSSWGNSGLWLALLGFLAARGLTLGGYFSYLRKREALCVA